MSKGRMQTAIVVAAIALGAGTIVVVPAQAADLGTITVTGAASPYGYSPTTLSGAIGDTFTVVDGTTGGASISVSYDSGGGDTGEVSVGALPLGQECTVGQATCIAAPGGGTTYTINKLGTISITAQPGGLVGKITLSSPSNATPAPSSYTATADSNGGVCTGARSWTRMPGNAAFAGVFTLPTAAQCTRTGFTLLGWADSADATRAAYAPGAQYTMGNADVTLYAVWSSDGLVIIYDANVAMADQCLANGANVATRSGRRATVTVPAEATGQAAVLYATGLVHWADRGVPAAPCVPPGLRLVGWSDSPGGSPLNTDQTTGTIIQTVGLGGRVYPGANTLTLYAKWEAGSITITG